MQLRRAASAAAAALMLVVGVGTTTARAAILSENFDEPGGFFGNTGIAPNLPSVPVVPGWSVQNRSTTTGTHSWFSGSASSPNFGPQAGTGYAAVDVNSTTGQATISNWLISPVISFNAGDRVSFFTRTATPVEFPDRLQLRLSTNGSSTNVGSSDTSFGDFSTTMLEINPNQTFSGYPTAWTEVTATFPSSGTGRIAFRYFLTNGGPAGDNGFYVGIDSLNVIAVPEPASVITLSGLACVGALAARRRRATN
jgi:hypothetical protein